MFVLKVSGRTSMELRDTYGSYEEQLRRSLSLLDGHDRFSFLLFYVPDDAGWPDGPGFDVRKFEREYLQSAGTAQAMVVELRRLEPDGRYRQYALGRPALPRGEPTVEIKWAQNSMTVPANEVFDAVEATRIYLNYFQHRSVPNTYVLRELDLN